MLTGETEAAIRLIGEQLLSRQAEDGSWRFCFESGPMTDAFMIVTLKILGMDDDELVGKLADAIAKRRGDDGTWRVYPDETEGNLSATVQALIGLAAAGVNVGERKYEETFRWLKLRGGIAEADTLTKVMAAVVNKYRWRNPFFIPLEFLLIPSSAPLSFFDFAGYARVHIAPVLLLADKKFSAGLKELERLTLTGEEGQHADDEERLPDEAKKWIERLKEAIASIGQLPEKIHSEATRKTERFMRERIEPDGTLYSYASATFLMIFALLALGINRHDPVIVNAVQGLKTFVAPAGDGRPHVQNSPSTVWDTALISYALQSAGYTSHEAVKKAGGYLLSRQHTRYGDWRIRNERAIPGGWGFSDSNTINPDVDDTTAALRAIRLLRDAGDQAYRESWNRGLQWVLSMQNDDGGWPAFEKNTDKSLFTLLPVQNAEAAAIDPSSADLTGRTLEFLGAHAGMRAVLPFVRRGIGWLYDHQQDNGSWYGRWGICYLYGTWAALTGLSAVGVPSEERNVKRAVRWLREVQNDDGGWGESCRSDQAKEYVPSGKSTLSQTAWAVEAILSVERSASEEVNRGVRLLVEAAAEPKRLPPKQLRYPTGAGLPGSFYVYYHSYNYIWPLLALCRYREHASR